MEIHFPLDSPDYWLFDYIQQSLGHEHDETGLGNQYSKRFRIKSGHKLKYILQKIN